MSEQRRVLTRPGPRPVSISLGSRPVSLPILAPMADGSFDAGSQSFHAAALSLLDEDGEPYTASTTTSMKDLATATASSDATKPSSISSITDAYTAPDVDDTHTDSPRSRQSFHTAENDLEHDSGSNPDHSQSVALLDLDQLLQRRASFPVPIPDDRDTPGLDNVFEPEISPARKSLFLPSDFRRSRRSSAYTLASAATSRAASNGDKHEHSFMKHSPLPTPLPSPVKLHYDGMPDTAEEDESYSPDMSYPAEHDRTFSSVPDRNPTDEHVSYTRDFATDERHEQTRPSAPTPNRANTVDTVTPSTSGSHFLSPTLVASPDTDAPPHTTSMNDMLKELKRQDSVRPNPRLAAAQATKSMSIEAVGKYAVFCVTLWFKAVTAAIRSIGNPPHVLHILAFAFLSTMLPIIQYFVHLSQYTWSTVRSNYHIPAITQLLRLKHENDFTLWDCLSNEQAEAGKLALSLSRHDDTTRVFDLDAARFLLQLNGLLHLRSPSSGPSARFAKQGEQYIRLSAASIGLEYTTVSELNTSSSTYCAAFYDIHSNWIVLAFKGESITEVDEWISSALSPSVHVGQHLHGFGKVRSCYADRLFPRKPSSESRIPYHTIIRTVRIIASQLQSNGRVQLYFTGHGSGAAVASLAMSAALDSRPDEFGDWVEVRDGYAFGAPTICDKKSVIAFNHKQSRHWENPSVLWRIINPKDSLARHNSWNLESSTRHHLGIGLMLAPHSSKITVTDKHASHSNLQASYQRSPRLGRSLGPARSQSDTAARLRRLVHGWPVVGGIVNNSLGSYWDLMKHAKELEFEWA